MEYTIAHETSYVYPKSVHESYTVVHLQPRSDQSQFCSKYELRVQPESSPLSYVDRFGNDVQHFAILPAHDALSITTRSHVVTLPSSEPTRPAAATRALLETDRKVPRFYDFLHDSAYVRAGPELDDFVAELEPPGERIGAWCLDLAAAIHRGFAYDRTATNVRTAVAGALAARAGVCQDFAHIMIAALRGAGIPARYVSGYIFGGDSTVLGAEASHAWCEAYLPPYGWVGFDPTNDRLIDDSFVRGAVGRDYGDVSPVRGIYRGGGASEMSVNVAMDLLTGTQQQ